ncbi:MAG: cytochrome C oxidase subunit II [Magnetococcales bacterium]|nr:cytochrome C oxidase subunit II [Magnetococcales bacterium]MBF0582999.1 cytochrome C oxidase subunit II [Magnetococcales bacterium]
MSITPPSQRIWWKEPIHKIEATWIIIALAWCLVLFLWMPYWHVYGKQNLSNESYKTTPAAFEAKAKAMVDKYTVRKETKEDIPVVAPPVGSDVYLVGRLWSWWPILELEKDKSYRIHISSLDYQHGFSLQPTNMNLQILPGYETVITLTPNQKGDFGIVCNEYCGIGHHNMLGKIIVK